ncbi:MAG: tRNA dihydrouridine synthase DusB [Ectothiorhodospiraceae bacterium]|nr:tRNA dihydrouridine synthase DusB [Ectothiorhodospiraceae bacterium]
MRIGGYVLPNNLALAPMAGVTDRPFRMLCKSLGAGMAASEMVASNPALRNSRKSRLKAEHSGEPEPRIIQIAGAEPAWMEDAARYNVANGAQIIDINMGCPAKKVCNKAAGSALLSDEGLVREILQATVQAVDVPVTLKIRTGPAPDRRNGVRIAEMAQTLGIQALAVHGRTRADAYRGQAEYDTIRAICSSVSIPVLANGDIRTPEEAARVLAYTGAAGVMIGRAAQGRPWLFREIAHYLDTGRHLPAPSVQEIRDIMLAHLRELHRFYGEIQGMRVARKHIGWYLAEQPGGERTRRQLVRVESAAEQLALTEDYFRQLERLPAATPARHAAAG